MKKFTLILITLFIALTGCARQPKYTFEGRKISIATQPSGAKVYQVNSAFRNETFLGTTPINEQPVSVLTHVKGRVTPNLMDWFATQMYMVNVKIEKQGYKTYEGNLATHPEETTKHSIPLSK